MESAELIELMEKVEAKGMNWNDVGKKIKVSHALLKLYANSGPVPVTIIKNLKKIIEEGTQ